MIDEDKFIDARGSQDRGDGLDKAGSGLPGNRDDTQTRVRYRAGFRAARKNTLVAANATVPWCHSCQTP